jgi:hypothetical protein
MSTPNYLVTFDFAQFALEYPEFATVNPVRAQSMFNMAQLSLLDNYGGLPIAVPQLAELFNMLVAHLLTLFARRSGACRPRRRAQLMSRSSTRFQRVVRYHPGITRRNTALCFGSQRRASVALDTTRQGIPASALRATSTRRRSTFQAVTRRAGSK